jgi:transcriptional regulator GlxA family with amidase domain
MDQKRVGILIFDDVEVLDFCGPFEVFSVTRLNEERRREEPSPFRVALIAESKNPVVATGGLRVLPDYTLEDCPPLNILVVPGGWGTRKEINNEKLLKWIRARATEVETLSSVCTGSVLLGKAGLLDGRRATTHWRALPWMREVLPQVIVEDSWHVIVDDNIYTSAGISAGIDMALRIVGRYHGDEIAQATARQMEYAFLETNNRRVDLAKFS